MKKLTFNVSGMVLTTLVSKQFFGPGILQTLQAAKGNSAAAVIIVAWVYYGKRPVHCSRTACGILSRCLQPLLPHWCKACLPAVWRTLDTVNEWFEDKVVGSKS